MFSIRTLSDGDYLYRGTQRVAWKASPHRNVGFGGHARKFLVMHYTGGASGQSSVDWFADPASKVSAHVVIDRDGTVFQCVAFGNRAWHCGDSRWRDPSGVLFTGLNNHSIGIELANAGPCRQTAAGAWRNGLGVGVAAADIIETEHRHGPVYFAPNAKGVPVGSVQRPGWEVYPEPQLVAARAVAAALVEHYGLTEIVGHDDISPGRKSDPGPLFDTAGFRGSLAGEAGEGPGTWRVRPGTPGGLAIRVGPGKDYAKVQENNLPVGTEVAVNQTIGLWWQVTVLDAAGNNMLDGWVYSPYLAPA